MGFIQDFLEYNVGNECPRDYILWSGYTALSLAVGRRVFLDMEHFLVNCNIYTCLVGPAGNRKTFARDKAFDLLREVFPDIIVSAECETKQGITKFMGAPEQMRWFTNEKGERIEYRPYGLFASELMNYLALDPAGMVTFLTDIYDRKFYQYRLKNEEHTLVNPYFVMLACTVPEWLCRQVKSEEFCSGFGRRTIFVCDDSDMRMKPVLSDTSRIAYVNCKSRLSKVREIVGEFKMTDDAAKWFWKEWYPSFKLSDDRFMRAWERSQHIQLCKIAMLTSISEGDDKVITKNYLQLALALLEHIKKALPMITNRMGRSELVEPAMQLLTVVKNHGGFIEKKKLLALTFKDFRNAMEQWSTLEHLRSTSQLEEVEHGGKKVIALPVCIVRKSDGGAALSPGVLPASTASTEPPPTAPLA
jgi:hypothetical protein